MSGQGIISMWLRFFLGLIEWTIAFSRRGGVFAIAEGLILLCLVASVVALPMLALTVVYFGQKAFQAIADRRSLSA